jgi:hypothetical protein
MPGYDWPALDEGEIRRAFTCPTGTPRLRDLAQGKREAVIIFDDISRPTPIDRLWPFVVEELAAAGFKDRNIRFIVALGMHGAHSREDFRRKLGEEALGRFPIYNHNPYENCTYVGTTSRGTPVEVNDEVLACDLRIGIGAVLPHPDAGFGGGPKIVMPGVVSYKTIRSNHGSLLPNLREMGHGETLRPGCTYNLFWQDIAECANLAGLDFLVNCVLNGHRQVVGVFAGHFLKVWEEGVMMGKDAYATEPVPEVDLVIANAYGKGNECFIAAWAPEWTLDGREKDLVVIGTCPQGQVVHYSMGHFGDHARGKLAPQRLLPPGIRRLIVYNPHPERSAAHWYTNSGKDVQASTWDAVLAQLQEWYPNRARVAVYPDLTVQYLARPASPPSAPALTTTAQTFAASSLGTGAAFENRLLRP